jgi:hypothetical protein
MRSIRRFVLPTSAPRQRDSKLIRELAIGCLQRHAGNLPDSGGIIP